jgi:hypothetical protein
MSLKDDHPIASDNFGFALGILAPSESFILVPLYETNADQIVSIASTENTPFGAAVELHPSGLDPADAPKITIPLCMLASQDEDGSTVKAFDDGLVVPKLVETYDGAPHVSLFSMPPLGINDLV